MLGGGPASQHPQLPIEQIRGVLPRAVTPPSSRYPQLKCVLMCFFAKMPLRRAGRVIRIMLNDARTRSPLHQFKTTVWIYPAAVRVR
jgi:hypothetical protein